jgi:SNF2 family DNA or RNA helicase
VLSTQLIKPSELSKKLNPLQSQAVEAFISERGCESLLLLMDQRTGKTLITLRILQIIEPTDVLIVVPKNNIVSTWETHIQEHLPQYTIHRTWQAYIDHQKHSLKTEGVLDLCILLVNYEALPSVYKRLRKHRWSFIVYDEAQRLKSRTSRSAGIAKGLVQRSDRRLALTGTPLDQSPIEMFSIMRFVEPEALGYTWKEFEEEYLVVKKIDWRKAKGTMRKRQLMIAAVKDRKNPKFKPGKLEQLYARVAPYVLRVTQEDMGIKPAEVTRVPVFMGGEQKRAYDELELTMVFTINDVTILTPMKATKLIKLQQITGGFIYDEDKNIHKTGKAKLWKLRSLLKHLTLPVVIFCKFRPEIELIKTALSGRIAEIHGGIKDKKNHPHRTDIIQAFQRGEYDYLICQQRTGGVGIDLYHARKAIVYSMGHSGIDYRQMISRLTYLHQKEAAEWWILYVPDTVDEDILVAQDAKKKVFEVTMDRLRRKYH